MSLRHTPEASTFAERFKRYTEESNAIHREYLGDALLSRQYRYFVAWQAEYLLPFYDEFRQRPETEAAVEYVVSDLTGIGMSERDREIGRVVPLMIRLLPDKALRTLASAMELNARVLAINLETCRCLLEHSDFSNGISERHYCAALRQATTLDECMELVTLTIRLGEHLSRIIRIPVMGVTLSAMHIPAHSAGFGELQDFLEKGYRTFRAIPDVDSFLDRLSVRMTKVFSGVCENPLELLDTAPFHPASERT